VNQYSGIHGLAALGESHTICGMSTVLEIEQAIDHLHPQEFRALASWMQEKIDADADRVFEQSVLAGKFAPLAAQALKEIAAGQTMPLDEFLRHR
jgi:hypothetical protein